MNVIGSTTNAKTFTPGIANDSRKVGIQFATHIFVKKSKTFFRTEGDMDQQKTQRLGHEANYRSGLQPSFVSTTRSWGFAPRWYSAAPLALAFAAITLIAGCNKTSQPTPQNNSAASATSSASQAPTPSSTFTTASTPTPTPTAPPTPVPPLPFKLFHQSDATITLVTDPNATDAQITAILWELRDAAVTHSFDKLHIPQKLVDGRDPIMWFHVYRGPKCASEKYTTGKLPCGASYHAAGEFTYGGFSNRERTAGTLIRDENHETILWDPDKPYSPSTK